MKKLKMWSMLMLVVMMLPLSSSCSKDSDDKENPLVGIWIYVWDDNFYQEFDFAANMKFTLRSVYKNELPSDEGTCNYIIIGDKVIINPEGESLTYYFFVNGDELTLEIPGSNTPFVMKRKVSK